MSCRGISYTLAILRSALGRAGTGLCGRRASRECSLADALSQQHPSFTSARCERALARQIHSGMSVDEKLIAKRQGDVCSLPRRGQKLSTECQGCLPAAELLLLLLYSYFTATATKTEILALQFECSLLLSAAFCCTMESQFTARRHGIPVYFTTIIEFQFTARRQTHI